MEIKIGICDDEQIQIDNVKKLVRNWADESNFCVKIQEFLSGESFIFHYEDDKNFDILLLDIEMGEINGVELAKKIRLENENVQIVFITGFADFMAEGYEVSALHYLMKPVSYDKLSEVLKKAVSLLNKQEKYILLDNIKVNPAEIMFVEAFAHNCQVTMLSEEKIKIARKISSLESELNDEKLGFIRCHRSYLVGIRHIKKISKTEIILDNNSVIPLSRRLYTEVNKAFISYFRGSN